MKIKKHIMSNIIIVLRSLEVPKMLIIAILALKTLMTIKNWKILKPLFSEKVNTNRNITLVDNYNIISSEIEIAEKLYMF